MANKGTVPLARENHSAVVYNDAMYVFGGFGGAKYADLHKFSFGMRDAQMSDVIVMILTMAITTMP